MLQGPGTPPQEEQLRDGNGCVLPKDEPGRRAGAALVLLEAVQSDLAQAVPIAGPALALLPEEVSQEPLCSMERKLSLPKEVGTFKQCPCPQPHLTYERQSQAENPGDTAALPLTKRVDRDQRLGRWCRWRTFWKEQVGGFRSQG